MSFIGDFLRAGLLPASGNLTILNGNLTLTSGNLTLTSGTLTVTGNTTITGDLTIPSDDIIITAGDLNITLGGITLTAGNIVNTLGDVTLTAGNLLLTLGNLTMTAGNFVNTLGDVTLTAGNLLLTLGNLTLTNGNLVLTVSEFIKGQQFTVSSAELDSTAFDLGNVFWTAPAACTVLSAYSSQKTVAGQTCTAQIEKLTAGEARDGNGDALLAAVFNAESTANTPVSKAAITSGAEVLAAGDRLALLGIGTSTSLVGFTATVTLKWN